MVLSNSTLLFALTLSSSTLVAQPNGNNSLTISKTEQVATSSQPAKATANHSKDILYVRSSLLSVRAKPSMKGKVLRTLKFNDEIIKLSDAKPGWIQIGPDEYVGTTYLSDAPGKAPKNPAPKLKSKAQETATTANPPS